MKSEILYPGAFPMVRVYLAEAETVKAESGAMVATRALAMRSGAEAVVGIAAMA